MTRKTANQSVENMIPAKKKQRNDNGRDLSQKYPEEQKDDQEKNVSFCFINASYNKT